MKTDSLIIRPLTQLSPQKLSAIHYFKKICIFYVNSKKKLIRLVKTKRKEKSDLFAKIFATFFANWQLEEVVSTCRDVRRLQRGWKMLLVVHPAEMFLKDPEFYNSRHNFWVLLSLLIMLLKNS